MNKFLEARTKGVSTTKQTEDVLQRGRCDEKSGQFAWTGNSPTALLDSHSLGRLIEGALGLDGISLKASIMHGWLVALCLC